MISELETSPYSFLELDKTIRNILDISCNHEILEEVMIILYYWNLDIDKFCNLRVYEKRIWTKIKVAYNPKLTVEEFARRYGISIFLPNKIQRTLSQNLGDLNLIMRNL